jgi:carbonic anhydrase
METFDDEVMRGLLSKSLDTAEFDGHAWRDVGRTPGSTEGDFVDWLAISDQERSIVSDVRRLRTHPLVPGYLPIHGYLYDVATGTLREIAAATQAGQPIPGAHPARPGTHAKRRS